jgi:hypothetical protein
MIAKLAGVALDARVASRIGDSRSRALAAQWIARNALAARGVRVDGRGGDILGRCALDVDRFSLARGSSPRLPVDDFAASMGELGHGDGIAVDGTRDDVDGESAAMGIDDAGDSRWLAIRATTLTGLLAALAAIPALVDATTIPRRWRLGLRALGLPMLDKPLADAPPPMAGSIALAARPWLDGASTCSVYLDVFAAGYRVRAW